MRTHVLFLILWSLLLLSRVADLVTDAGRYAIATSFGHALRASPNARTADDPEVSAPLEQRRAHLTAACDAGVEILLLGGVCFCFFRAWGIRNDSASPYVLASKPRHA